MTQQLPDAPVVAGTHHAPAERATAAELEALAQNAFDDPILAVVFEAVGGLAMVLDRHRQVVAANQELLTALCIETGDSILGLRPGEAVQCLNAHRGPGGCGTSQQCRHCGAVAAILAAQGSESPVDGQCTLTRWNEGSPQLVDFQVRVRPLDLSGERVYVLVFHDVTAAKWHNLQNRMFLHDLANMLTGLSGWSSVLADEPASEAATEIIHMVRRLGDTLKSHRLLLQCESGELKLAPQPVAVDVLTADLKAWFEPIAAARQCHFLIDCKTGALKLVTDIPLLVRVLGNLVSNAIEASAPGATVTLTLCPEELQTVFTVHNPGFIPKDAASQLFKSRFSTKGAGRGLGMYSVQVFGEQYLGGHVDFETSMDQGTVFRFAIPNVLNA